MEMLPKNRIDLVANCLPTPEARAIFKNTAAAMRISDIRQALRAYGAVDWQAYLRDNPDIAQAGQDAFEHFVTRGMFENRKLAIHSGKNLFSQSSAVQPLISVIIASYNNSVFLKRCIESVLEQTLKNIEVIIIDDHSTDDSDEIICAYTKIDTRIRYAVHICNQSQHMSRKLGVELADGEYIMFVDSDDFLRADACELAYNAVHPAYDFAHFDTSVVNFSNCSQNIINKLHQHYNSAPPGEYIGRDKLFAKVFLDREMTHNVWNKIFKSDICKQAFAHMKDGFYPGAQDLYEYIVIASKCNSAIKLCENLYFHSYGVGVSDPRKMQGDKRFFALPGDVLQIIKDFCEEDALNCYFPAIKQLLFGWSLDKLLNGVADDEFIAYINLLRSQYSFPYVVDGLCDKLSNRIDAIEVRYKQYKMNYANFDNVYAKRIAIYYRCEGSGYDDFIISTLCAAIQRANYDVCVLLENTANVVPDLHVTCHIYSITSLPYNSNNLKIHILELDAALAETHADIVICHTAISPYLIWDMLVASCQGCSFIVQDASAFYSDSDNIEINSAHYDWRLHQKVLSCADVIICASLAKEISFRIMGTYAVKLYFPNEYLPSCNESKMQSNENSPNMLALFSRGSCWHEIEYGLNTIAQLLRHDNTIRVYIYFPNKNSQMHAQLTCKLIAMGLDANCSLTSSIESIKRLAQQSDVAISFAKSEKFDSPVRIAIANDIPCLICDETWEDGFETTNCYFVRDCSHIECSNNILSILKNKNLIDRSDKQSKQDAILDNFVTEIIILLKNLNASCNISTYAPSNYQILIRALSKTSAS